MKLNWDNANLWQEKVNEEKIIYNEPKWSWDCNFKLDFDGSLINVSSRFYPPHKNEGDWWEGNVTILFLEDEILKQEFQCNSLDELKDEVEEFVKIYINTLKTKIMQKNCEEWKIESVDRYYYASGRNYWTYKEITYWYEIHTLDKKETVREETILINNEWRLPEWAKGITTRKRSLESNF